LALEARVAVSKTHEAVHQPAAPESAIHPGAANLPSSHVSFTKKGIHHPSICNTLLPNLIFMLFIPGVYWYGIASIIIIVSLVSCFKQTTSLSASYFGAFFVFARHDIDIHYTSRDFLLLFCCATYQIGLVHVGVVGVTSRKGGFGDLEYLV
jgi:hypothetical protein